LGDGILLKKEGGGKGVRIYCTNITAKGKEGYDLLRRGVSYFIEGGRGEDNLNSTHERKRKRRD